MMVADHESWIRCYNYMTARYFYLKDMLCLLCLLRLDYKYYGKEVATIQYFIPRLAGTRFHWSLHWRWSPNQSFTVASHRGYCHYLYYTTRMSTLILRWPAPLLLGPSKPRLMYGSGLLIYSIKSCQILTRGQKGLVRVVQPGVGILLLLYIPRHFTSASPHPPFILYSLLPYFWSRSLNVRKFDARKRVKSI
jgi:hypothetical protein